MFYVLHFLAVALFLYSIMIVLRVILSWVYPDPVSSPRILRYLHMFTDPYLQVFQRIKFLRQGILDLTPLAGLLILQILRDIVIRLQMLKGSLNVVLVSLIIFASFWNILSFFLLILIVISAVRLVSLLVLKFPTHRIWFFLDTLLAPFTNFIQRLFPRIKSFLSSLIMTLLFFCLLYFLGELAMQSLVSWATHVLKPVVG